MHVSNCYRAESVCENLHIDFVGLSSTISRDIYSHCGQAGQEIQNFRGKADGRVPPMAGEILRSLFRGRYKCARKMLRDIHSQFRGGEPRGGRTNYRLMGIASTNIRMQLDQLILPVDNQTGMSGAWRHERVRVSDRSVQNIFSLDSSTEAW